MTTFEMIFTFCGFGVAFWAAGLRYRLAAAERAVQDAEDEAWEARRAADATVAAVKGDRVWGLCGVMGSLRDGLPEGWSVSAEASTAVAVNVAEAIRVNQDWFRFPGAADALALRGVRVDTHDGEDHVLILRFTEKP